MPPCHHAEGRLGACSVLCCSWDSSFLLSQLAQVQLSEATGARPGRPFCNYTSPSGCCLLINIYKVLEAPLLSIQIPKGVLLSHEWSHYSPLSWPTIHKRLRPKFLWLCQPPICSHCSSPRAAFGCQAEASETSWWSRSKGLLTAQQKVVMETRPVGSRTEPLAAQPWPGSGNGVLLRLVLSAPAPPLGLERFALTTPLQRSNFYPWVEGDIK